MYACDLCQLVRLIKPDFIYPPRTGSNGQNARNPQKDQKPALITPHRTLLEAKREKLKIVYLHG
ncbi:hypothetical protein DAPPUDRAFT_238921 [Daphnia pulex]|uniref:Uncharacterized protein n=1 Tax=Daphnia pulex TaxID=6669 RepID=E9G7S9_DAPPU|nr:hypothetical protein DAPPUDRAFT_238921 [Daphnia pulex]|eukprot:EFX84533.1 hypothetical protein DAPPUDRAFT_238921 [Daphnia pulex]